MAADYEAKYEALRRAFVQILELDADADALAWYVNAESRHHEAQKTLNEIGDAKYWKKKYEDSRLDVAAEAELRQITQDEFAKYRKEHP